MDVTRTVTEADDNGEVTVRTGERLAVCLNENPSTGYRWSIEGALTRLRVVDTQYAGATAQIGSGGQACWILEAQSAGDETVSFRLWRHWEGDGSIVKRFGFRATVVSP